MTRDTLHSTLGRPVLRGALVLVVAAVVAVGLAVDPTSAVADRPTRGSSRAEDRPPRFLVSAAGDIACPPGDDVSIRECQQAGTADLLAGSDEVLLLGDNQYDHGTLPEYVGSFDPTWGAYGELIHPAPGNREYEDTSGPGPAAGYFAYFGAEAHGPDGYYSFNVPAGCTPADATCWHFIALNSQLCVAPSTFGGCNPGSPQGSPGREQLDWLARDLLANPETCTVAFFHHPLFSYDNSTTYPDDTTKIPDPSHGGVQSLVETLYEQRADIVLNGHVHHYERWRLMSWDGTAAPRRGVRQFTVGTGGRSLLPLPDEGRIRRPGRLAAAQATSFGVLVLRIVAARYRWTWRTAAGQPEYADAGRGRCVV